MIVKAVESTSDYKERCLGKICREDLVCYEN